MSPKMPLEGSTFEASFQYTFERHKKDTWNFRKTPFNSGFGLTRRDTSLEKSLKGGMKWKVYALKIGK